MLLCDCCQQVWHMACVLLPFSILHIMNGYAHTIPKDKSVKYKSSMQKGTLDLKRGGWVKLRNAPGTFCAKLSFILFWPRLSFVSWPPPLLLHIFSLTAPTCTTTIITLEPCGALNAEFQHFILRFNKTSLLCRYHSKRGIGGEKTPKDKGVKTWWLLRENSIMNKTWLCDDGKVLKGVKT